MTDIVALGTHSIKAVDHKKHRVENDRDRNEEHENELIGVEQAEYEENARDGARRAERSVVRVCAISPEREEAAAKQGPQIDEEEGLAPQNELQARSEEKERDHVEEEVHRVGMQEP